MGQRADQLGGEPGSARPAPTEDLADETPETIAARAEIERTRADMTSTIDAIQDKLDPEVLGEQAKDTAHDVTDYAVREAKAAAREATDHAIEQARAAVQDISGQAKAALREATIGRAEHMVRSANETAGGWRQSLVETIKANPVPAALAGLSIGWLYFNRPSGNGQPQRQLPSGYPYTGYRYSAEDRQPSGRSATEEAQAGIGQAVDQAQQTAGQVVGQAQQTAGQVMGQAQETGGQVLEQVQQQAGRAQGFLQQQLEENPLLVGAVAVTLGGVLAAMLRPTEREDQLFGDTRDRLTGSAQELTQDTMHKVGRVVNEAQQAAKQEAQEQGVLSSGGSDTTRGGAGSSTSRSS